LPARCGAANRRAQSQRKRRYTAIMPGQMGSLPRLAIALCLTGLGLAAGGCGRPILSVNDTMVADGDREVRLVAFVEREGLLGLRPAIENKHVAFTVDGRSPTTAITDACGRAVAECPVSPGGRVRRIEARTEVEARPLEADGRVFRWRRDRTIVSIDVDDTISKTEYESLLLDSKDSESDPLSGSRKALASIAEDFQLVYLTARPNGLHEKTRRWLEEHHFPPGPIVVSPRTIDVFSQEDFRRRTLADLRQCWPNLLIGIGDRTADARAHAANGMMSVLIRSDRPLESLPPNTLVFRKWRHARKFFESYRRELADPKRLTELIRRDQVSAWKDDRSD